MSKLGGYKDVVLSNLQQICKDSQSTVIAYVMPSEQLKERQIKGWKEKQWFVVK